MPSLSAVEQAPYCPQRNHDSEEGQSSHQSQFIRTLKTLDIGFNQDNFGFGYLNVEERLGHSRSLNLVIHTPTLFTAKYPCSFLSPRRLSTTEAERPANLCSTTLVS